MQNRKDDPRFQLAKIRKLLYPIAIKANNMDFKKLKNKTQALKRQNEKLLNEIKLLKQNIEPIQSEVKTREISIELLDEQQAEEIQKLKDENKNLKKLNAKQKVEISQYQSDIERFKQEKEERDEQIKKLKKNDRINRIQTDQQTEKLQKLKDENINLKKLNAKYEEEISRYQNNIERFKQEKEERDEQIKLLKKNDRINRIQTDQQTEKMQKLKDKNINLKKLNTKYEEEISRYQSDIERFKQEKEERDEQIKLLEEKNRNNQILINQQAEKLKKNDIIFGKIVSKYKNNNKRTKKSLETIKEYIEPENTGIEEFSEKLENDFEVVQLKDVIIERLKKRVSELVLNLQKAQNENVQLNNAISQLKIQLKEKSKEPKSSQSDDDVSDLIEIKSFVNKMNSELVSIQKESEKLEIECAKKDALIDLLKARIVELTD